MAKISDFHGNGFFDWQFSTQGHLDAWNNRHYDEEKYWGDFPRDPLPADYKLPHWAIGPFEKHEGNPVFAPDPNSWDCGHFGGGVHNGAIIIKNGVYHYIYRGELPLPDKYKSNPDIDYIDDIGLAISADGISWKREAGPFFRHGEDEKYDFSDVSMATYNGKYYMFINRWDWSCFHDPKYNGVFLAVSDDLYHWEKRGLVFPDAKRIHRNASILQNPKNEAVRVNGKFVLFINDRIIAFSDDMEHWESDEMEAFPGGECAFSVCDYDADHPDNVVLFTGGHHTGHFYAKGEVLLDKNDIKKPVAWLPRPVLYSEPQHPWENGYSADGKIPVSYWRDTVFVTHMTLHEGKWLAYYGGSEYYTCLATAPYTHKPIL